MADSAGYRKYNKLLSDLGAAGLNSLYPNDFEFYYTAFELTDSENRTISYLGFPINPQSIQKTESKRMTVKKSASGTTVISNQSTIPSEITIKGNFGKTFKILMTPNEEIEGNAWGFEISKTRNGGYEMVDYPSFDAQLKNGFGCTKVLQKIIQQSSYIDPNTGQPNRLYFYNLALSESYLVEVNPNGFQLSQSEDQNMIWQYSINMTILANVEDLHLPNKLSTKSLMKAQNIQSGINFVANSAKDFILSRFNSGLYDLEYQMKGLRRDDLFDNYINRFITWVNVSLGDFSDYYLGIRKSLSQDSINSFEELKITHQTVLSNIENGGNYFTTIDAWELLDIVDSIGVSLDTIDNLDKWTRSSGTSKDVTLNFVQKQGQSLEAISKLSGFTTHQDSWMDIALKNKMIEEDYTSQGGKLMTLNFANGVDFSINNVVDVLEGKNIYGKDILKTWTFDNGDVATVEYDDCIDQSIDTIFGTIQGGIPEFPEDGFPSALVGSNLNSLQYPVIVRSISNMLQKDDRFSSIELIKINKSEDNAFIDFSVKTKLNESKMKGVSI